MRFRTQKPPAVEQQAPAPDVDPGVLPAWLLKQTFVLQYNPNCPSPYLVRLPGYLAGGVDNKTYYGPVEGRTRDCLGFGKTIEAAALAALAEHEKGRLAFEGRMAEQRRADEEARQRRRDQLLASAES